MVRKSYIPYVRVRAYNVETSYASFGVRVFVRTYVWRTGVSIFREIDPGWDPLIWNPGVGVIWILIY